MTTLSTNQQLILPSASDVANVPTSFSNYNSGSENRLVQRYLSSADRTTRNPTPNEGELSYLIDTDRYFYYTGSTWLDLSLATSIVLSGVTHTVGGSVAVTTTETAFPAYDVTNVALISGNRYALNMAMQVRSTVSGDVGEIRWRQTTAVTGTLIVSLRMTNLFTSNDHQFARQIFIAGSTATITLRCSAVRVGGTGTVTASTSTAVAGNNTFVYVEQLSNSTFWTTA